MKKIYRFLATFVFLGAVVTSCDSFDETNTDPTRMSDATAGSFLNPVIYGMSTYNWNRYNSWTFPLTQSIVSTSSTAGTGWYTFSDAAGDGTWTNYYKWATNCQAIYDKAVAADATNYKAIATTLQCWIYQLIADAFGDMPMEEAGRGEQGVLYPKFDRQVDVYKKLIARLDSANGWFAPKSGLQYNNSGDMLYCVSGTDQEGIKRWQRFNNSLLLRVLLRVVDVPELDAATKIKAILSDPATYPVFESNADNANVSVSGVAPQEAPMVRPSDFTSYKVLSSFFIDRLKVWKDPRLPFFARTVTNNGVKGYEGIEPGYSVLPDGNYSQPNTDNLAVAPMDLNLMTYSELLFIKAELAQRGIIADSAEALYREAVTAAITQWGLEMPANYFENAMAAYDGTLKRIMEQKFYALFFVDYQQWFEHNRTGMPEIPVGKGVDAGHGMPARFKYPAILQRTNMANYEQAVAAMGGDDFNQKLIWQKKIDDDNDENDDFSSNGIQSGRSAPSPRIGDECCRWETQSCDKCKGRKNDTRIFV